MPRLRTDPQEVTYHAVRRLIYQRVNKFRDTRGGDFDDWLSAAHEGFVRAYRSFNPSRGKFSTWVQWNVDGRLKSHARAQYKRKKRESGRVYVDLTIIAEWGTGWDARAFLGGLSEDGRTVAEIALRSPQEIMAAVRGDDEGVEPRPVRHKRAVRMLLRKLGWSVKRVDRAFEELRESLE